jgi:hypothetical protein
LYTFYIANFKAILKSKLKIGVSGVSNKRYIKDQVPINSEHELAGFNNQPYGDFDAKMLRVGLKNLEHTIMYLDFAMKYRHDLDIRHNLYAVREYSYIHQDTGSERYEHLVAKFDNYRNYLDYCIEKGLGVTWKGMLFVCKETNLDIASPYDY